MKNFSNLDRKLAQILFFLCVLAATCSSSCSSHRAAEQISTPAPEPEKIALSASLVDSFGITPAILVGAQIFSGPDTIILERGLASAKSALGSGGTIIFSGGVPVERQAITSSTPGVVTKIITDQKTKKIKLVEVDFGFGSLVFGPADDSAGSFVLYTNSKNQVGVEGFTYMLIAGGGAGNPIFILPEWKTLQGTQKIAPGRRVGQTTKKKKKD